MLVTRVSQDQGEILAGTAVWGILVGQGLLVLEEREGMLAVQAPGDFRG